MDSHDLTDQRQSKTYATQSPAAGFVHPEKWFKDSFFHICRNSASVIHNLYTDLFFITANRNLYLTAGIVILDGIFHQVIYDPIDQDITSHHRYCIANTFENNIFFLGKRIKICQHFFNQCIHFNFFISTVCNSLISNSVFTILLRRSF